MPAEYTAAIASLQAQLQKEQQKVRETKRMINRLAELDGSPMPFPDANVDETEQVSLGSLRRDLFYGVPLATAIRKYLEMRRAAGQGPATVSEIYSTLKAGGYKFGTDDEMNAKRGLYTSLNKNSTTFHRVQSAEGDKDKASVFGLGEWYGNIKSATDDGKKRRKRRKVSKPVKAPATRKTKPAPKLLESVAASKGAAERTKPDAPLGPGKKPEKG